MVQKSLDLPKSAYKSLAIVYDVSFMFMYLCMKAGWSWLLNGNSIYMYAPPEGIVFALAHWQSF